MTFEGVVLEARPVIWDDDQGFIPAGPWQDGLQGDWTQIAEGYATLGNGHHYQVEVASVCCVCGDLLTPETATSDGACEKGYCQRTTL